MGFFFNAIVNCCMIDDNADKDRCINTVTTKIGPKWIMVVNTTIVQP